jgi:hypothetical protein
MLFCQLGAARSLRETCNGLDVSERKLRHLGIPGAPNRFTLSFASERRPGELYQTGFEELLDRRYSLDAPFQTPFWRACTTASWHWVSELPQIGQQNTERYGRTSQNPRP